MRKVAWGAALALVAVGCGQPPNRWGGKKAATPTANTAAPSVDYGAAMEREVQGTYPVHPVAVLNNAYTSQLMATAAPRVEAGSDAEGTAMAKLFFRIGAGSEMSCEIRGARKDAGSLVKEKIDELTKALEKVNAKLGTPEINVEVEGSRPVLYADVPVTVSKAPGQERPGLIKLAVSVRDGGSLLCMHDEIGYKKTFRKIVGGLVTNTTIAGDRPQPAYSEISIAKVEGKTVGYAESNEFTQDNGVRLVQVMVLANNKRVDGKPVWTFTDMVRVTVASAKGEIQNIKTIALANRKPVTSMELKRRQANDYVYEGTVAGTKVKGSFNAPKPFETDGALAPRLLQLANGKPKELKYLAYDEEARVEGPIEVTATREDGKTIMLKTDDGRSWTTLIDALGLPERTMYSRDKEGERLIVERAYSQGQPSAAGGGGGKPKPAAAP